MSAPAPRSAVLWTGGKDSAMTLYEAGRRGYAVCCLVTFAPPSARFLAHPLTMMKMQSEALTLPHRVFAVGEPFEDGYEAALRQLKNELGIGHVVTGDIGEVNGRPNWIRERSRPVGMNVHTPLWGRDRSSLLGQFLERGFKARFSCVDMRWLDQGMIYSSAYFCSPVANVHTAQEQKLDILCRKLRLQSDQRLLDIGCSWGGLVIYAAQHYGVSATGITLSEPQVTSANQRITIRRWNLWMSRPIVSGGCSYLGLYTAFGGTTQCVQTLLVKPDQEVHRGLPLTSADWYD